MNHTTRKHPPVKKVYDRTGNRFGRLTVVDQAQRTKSGKTQWNCVCDCGGVKTATTSNLVTGHTTSCGCLLVEVIRLTKTTHGMRRTAEYKSWSEMRQRCSNAASKNYPDYGGRGIKVCDSWAHSFEAFFADMGLKPTQTHSLDRIDVNGDYKKSNCRWATPKQQASNRRSSILITAFGKTLNLIDWSRQTEISCREIKRRLSLPHLWTSEEALTMKKGEKRGD